MPDRTSRIRFGSVFVFKEGMDHTVKNRPDLIFDGLVRVWLNASGLEASWCAGIIGPRFWQDATGPLPVFRFQTRVRSSADVPDNTVPNQPGSGLVWLVVSGFGQTDPVRKQAGVQESFGPLLASASTLIRTGYEWDPAWLLDTLLGCLNVEIVLSALHSHGIFHCGHRFAEEGNCGACCGPSLVLTINRVLLVQSQTSWFPACLQLEISDFFGVCV